jgi:hypothetical protein
MEQKTQHFATAQESARKDIERAFGVLQSKFAVIRGPAYGWDRSQLHDIMMTCIILHNMIVEDEQGAANTDFSNVGELVDPFSRSEQRNEFVAAHHRLPDQPMHFQLQRDLMEHHLEPAGITAPAVGHVLIIKAFNISMSTLVCYVCVNTGTVISRSCTNY